MKRKLDVDDILKIIAEESVDAAYRAEKRNQEKYEIIVEKDEDEEEEGDDEDPKTLDDIDLDAELAKEKKGKEDKGEEKSEPEKEEKEQGEDENKSDDGEKKHYIQSPLILKRGEVTLEGVGSTLNMIRAGRSFGDADIAENLKTWFTKLSEAEKLTLGVYLDALKTIAEGGGVDEIAQTSDPSVDVDVTSGDDPTLRPEGPARPGDPPQKDLEDRTAPITVGPRDIKIEQRVREKIKSLLIE